MARLWDTDSGVLLHTLEGHTATLQAVALSTDGSVLATGSTDGTAKLWDTATGALLHTLDECGRTRCFLTLDADGSLLAASDGRATLRL